MLDRLEAWPASEHSNTLVFELKWNICPFWWSLYALQLPLLQRKVNAQRCPRYFFGRMPYSVMLKFLFWEFCKDFIMQIAQFLQIGRGLTTNSLSKKLDIFRRIRLCSATLGSKVKCAPQGLHPLSIAHRDTSKVLRLADRSFSPQAQRECTFPTNTVCTVAIY